MNQMHIFTMLISFMLFNCSGFRPKDIGVKEGQLKNCPDTPNCVSTQSTDTVHKIAPINYIGTKEEAINKMVIVINSLKRTKIITKSENYLYAEFTSALMRFVDDVEFYFDDTDKLIHFRSASRLGYSDLGVNRKRMEEISKLFLDSK
jgi:uncharacterized protein (DUF1499 family)